MENQDSVGFGQGKNKGLSPIFIFVGVFLIVGFAGYAVLSKTMSQAEQNKVSNQSVQAESVEGEVKEFTINGSSYAFNPATITVNQGDTLRINFKDADGTHDLVVEGYNVRTDVLSAGREDSITFVADKTGSFKYYCSIGSHADLGMTGTLIVE